VTLRKYVRPYVRSYGTSKLLLRAARHPFSFILFDSPFPFPASSLPHTYTYGLTRDTSHTDRDRLQVAGYSLLARVLQCLYVVVAIDTHGGTGT